MPPIDDKPDRESVESLGIPGETAPLATRPEPTPEEKLGAELGALARESANDLRDRVNLWAAHRLGLCHREMKLLTALKQQLADASQQRDADAVTRYLAQAVHLRSEILKLRAEPNDLTITGAPEGARWGETK